MDSILKNPYRTVGLLVGATAKEQERQVKRLKQFIEAEQKPESDYSFVCLGDLERNLENVNEAASRLNLDDDKMLAALFWFYKGNDITDEPAFDGLKEFDLENACSIWEKLIQTNEITKRNASALSNLSIIYLSGILEGTNTPEALYEKGISLKLKFLESDFALDLKKYATDATYKTTKKDLQLLFLNQIQFEIEKNKGITISKFFEILNNIEFLAKGDFIKEYSEKIIEQIEKLIEASKTKRKIKKEVIVAGTDLYNNSITKIRLLKSFLGISNIKYRSVCDKVSDEILQCGIQLFNTYREHKTYDPGKSSMDLFLMAKTFAIGNIAKQRCQENTENLQEWIEDKPEREIRQKVGKEIEFIIEKLNLASITLKDKGKYPKGYDDPYSKLPLDEQPHNVEKALRANDLESFYESNPYIGSRLDYHSMYKINEFNINLFYLARDIVQECKPKLEIIKNAVGASNEIYQKLSNDLASVALACLIEYVNHCGNSALNIPPNIDEHEINAMNAIGELDLNIENRRRHNEQKQSLYNLYKAVKKNSRSGSGSCYIATMAYGDYNHPQVIVLRRFRDNVLDKSTFGRWFIKNYYQYSPKMVKKLKDKEIVNFIIRNFLNQFIKLIK